MDNKLPSDSPLRALVDAEKAKRDNVVNQKKRVLLAQTVSAICDYGGSELPPSIKDEVSFFIDRDTPVFDFSVAAKIIYHHLLEKNTLTFCLPDTTPKIYVMNGVASELPKRDSELEVSESLRDVRKKWNGLGTTSLQVKEVLSWLARCSPQIDFQAFHDRPPSSSYVWFKNGVFDFALDGGAFIPLKQLTREEIQTKYIPPFVIPHNYKVDWKPNPNNAIEVFFNRVVPNDGKRLSLFQSIASALIPSLKARSVFMVGTGSNGKSIALEILRKFYGENNISSTSFTDLSEHRFSMYELVGKCANLVSEDPSNKVANTSTFRLLATQETLQVEQKFKERFPFKPYVKAFFAMNVLPIVEDITDAFLRRVVIIPFPFQFVSEGWDNVKTFEVNPSLVESFTEDDYEYLTGKLVDILKFLVFNPPSSPSGAEMERIHKEYSAYSNTVSMFAETVIEGVSESEDCRINQADLYEVYRRYCRANQITCFGRHKFVKEAHEIWDCKKSNGVNSVMNVRIRPAYERFVRET